MEVSEDGFLEELVSARRSSESEFPNTNCWGFDSIEESQVLAISSTNPSPFLSTQLVVSDDIMVTNQLNIADPFDHHHPYSFAVDHPLLTTPLISSPSHQLVDHFGFNTNCCKDEALMEQQKQGSEIVVPSSFNIGTGCGDVTKLKGRPKKLEGQPSKNLMAERRRRKRLNDRLSMLRSIVPKISKMDRTSILGDTIDYMKELMERITKLQQGIDQDCPNEQVNLSKDEVKPNEVLIRNSPKFDVERKEMETRIGMKCAARPGLLVSTVKTIEALGLEIQHCVISCFHDFSMQASCSHQGDEEGRVIECEDIKQVIFRNAGYGGRCL